MKTLFPKENFEIDAISFEVENFKIAACAFHRCPHMNFVTPSFWLGWVVGFPYLSGSLSVTLPPKSRTAVPLSSLLPNPSLDVGCATPYVVIRCGPWPTLLDMWITCFHPFLHSTRNPKGKKCECLSSMSVVLELFCVSTYRLNRYI